MGNYSKVGLDEFQNVVAVQDTKVVDYTFEDLDDSHQLTVPMPEGALLVDVIHETVEAFDADTTINIGDGTDADAYAAAAAVATKGNVVSSKGTSVAGANGVKLNAAGKIVLTASGAVTKGAGRLYIVYYDNKRSWRQTFTG